MKLLLVNQDWFADEFRAAGHEVATCGYRSHLEVKFDLPFPHIDSLISRIPQGFTPDRIIVYDDSSPVIVSGLDETEIPTVFYSVDTHHHANTHRYLAHLFDLTFVAQRDYIPGFESVGASAEWLPLWASTPMEPSLEKQYEAVFVGTLDRALNPERVDFFEALKTKAPVHVCTGAFWQIFPKSEIVINQTVRRDLNFRVFEAMMSGAALLTEKIENGLFDLFRDGEQLVSYTHGNVEDAAEKIAALISDRKRCREIGNAGREEILRAHLPIHRAQKVLEAIENLGRKPKASRGFAVITNYCWASRLYLKANSLGNANYAALLGLKSLERALREATAVDEEMACQAIFCCMVFDHISRSELGKSMLSLLQHSYPELWSPKFAQIWSLLSKGDSRAAGSLATTLLGTPEAETLAEIQKFMEQVLPEFLIKEA